MRRCLAVVLSIGVVSFFLSLSAVSARSIFTQSLLEPRVSAPSTLCVAHYPVVLSLPGNDEYRMVCHTNYDRIFEEFGYRYDEYEITFDTTKNGKRTIKAVPVTKKRILTWEKIPYSSEITYTKEVPHRKKIVDSPGKNGRRGIVTEEVTFPDGTKKKKVVSRWVEREPVVEIARIGTQYDLAVEEIKGTHVHYWKKLTVLATSYDSTCRGCNNITATGAFLRKGVVAVDPRVIPLYTKMYIPGYGFGQALDTGGFIKGNRIDLAYDDIRYGDWSRRWVTIYLID